MFKIHNIIYINILNIFFYKYIFIIFIDLYNYIYLKYFLDSKKMARTWFTTYPDKYFAKSTSRGGRNEILFSLVGIKIL